MNGRTWSLTLCVTAGVAVTTAGCSTPATTAAAAPDMVIDCTAGDIHHTFRINPSAHTVEDLSFSPSRRGVADVSDAEYRLQFHERRDNYDLILQIDRGSGRGTRNLFDDEQQAIKGHGGTDEIVCTLQP